MLSYFGYDGGRQYRLGWIRQENPAGYSNNGFRSPRMSGTDCRTTAYEEKHWKIRLSIQVVEYGFEILGLTLTRTWHRPWNTSFWIHFCFEWIFQCFSFKNSTVFRGKLTLKSTIESDKLANRIFYSNNFTNEWVVQKQPQRAYYRPNSPLSKSEKAMRPLVGHKIKFTSKFRWSKWILGVSWIREFAAK